MEQERKSVLANIRAHYSKMFAAEKRVAKFILNHPEEAIMMNVSELARRSDVSDATVIRMCKRIGYTGYSQMRVILANDLGKIQTNEVKNDGKRPGNIPELFQRFSASLVDVQRNLDEQTLFSCVELLQNADFVHIAAAGNTTPMANDLGFRLERFGVRATYSMVTDYMLNHLSLATERDVLIAISHSGTSRQVVQACELARQRGLKVIAITGSEYSPVSSMADYLLLSKVTHPVFSDYDPDSHLGVILVMDTLLYFLANSEKLKRSDDIELILSEYKL
mgnify:FL=1